MKKKPEKLGTCIICGEMVFTNDDYLKATEGHTHHSCIAKTEAF